jgi:2-octaprenyl-6-methoxyphenol hydroxylase
VALHYRCLSPGWGGRRARRDRIGTFGSKLRANRLLRVVAGGFARALRAVLAIACPFLVQPHPCRRAPAPHMLMRMNTSHDVAVAVVGAGPVGATLACALAEAGVPTAVIDRAPLPPMEDPGFDGRAYAVARGSKAVLEAAGIWARLGDRPCPILGIRVSDGAPGRPASPFTLDFDPEDLPESEGKPFGWLVEARHLRIALNAQLPRIPNLLCFAPAALQSVTRDESGATLTLADGTRIAARLVVAAEGRESPLREAAGIRVTRFAYRQAALVCAVAHERPHNHVAVEHFLPAGPFAILPLPDGPLLPSPPGFGGRGSGEGERAAQEALGGSARHPHPGHWSLRAQSLSGEGDARTGEATSPAAEHRSAIVWTDRPETILRAKNMTDAALAREIARRFGDFLGAVRPIGLRWHYPLAALHAHRYTATRLALAGDAAHGIHPIAGQGLNLGFRDAGVLAELVTGAWNAKLDPGGPQVLRQYERQRRPANLAMLFATDALDRLFSTDFPPVRIARGLGISAVDRLPRLKRFFMRTAMGL